MIETSRSDWAAAEAAAERHRRARQHPDARARAADRVLRPAAIVLWVAASAVALLGLLVPGPSGEVLGLAAYGPLFAYAAVALVWALRTRRWLWRGSAESIRTALPTGSWPAVRRQLALRESRGAEHRDVVVELAHQQRRLFGGTLALAAFYIPLYIGIAHSNQGWLRYGILALGAVLGTWGAVIGVIGYRRLGRITADA